MAWHWELSVGMVMSKSRVLEAFLLVCAVQVVGPPLALAADNKAAPIVLAQLFNRPSVDVPEGGGQDAAGLLVRIDRLEAQIRAMTGQIEQLLFQQHKLEETLRRSQQDTEFRFQEMQGRSGQAGLPRTNPPAPTGTAVPVAGAGAGTPPFAGPVAPAAPPPAKRGDAFDPSVQPNAPGAPRPLGSAPVDGPALASEPAAPMDLTKPQRSRTAALANPVQSDAAPPHAVVAPGGTNVAALPPGVQRDEFEAGRGLFKQGHFDAAQTAFETFLQKNPKDARVPEATYFLGESYFQRGRHREAAEEYLKLSTEYPKAPRAPEGLLRLGMSLNALGAKEQACATFQEVGRKYPNSSDTIKSAADREFKRAKC
jgi:tol-pal system protein YbgF